MTYRTKTISHEARGYAFWALVGISLLAFATYVYAVNMTIRNTALRQNLEGEVTKLAAESGALEFAYIEKRNSVNIELAHAYGFKEVSSPLYVSRASSRALTLNTVR